MDFSTVLRCPVCGRPLTAHSGEVPLKNGLSRTRLLCLKCDGGHSFDAAKEGYVSLLTGGSSPSEHGDNREMIDARTKFFDGGYYEVFRDAVTNIVRSLGGETLLDIGCGEGYYTEKMHRGSTVMLDISKFALKSAARRMNAVFPNAVATGEIALLCGTSASLPLLDASVDTAVNLFAPLDVGEIARVTRRGGHFVYAVPTERHLYGLKEVLYDAPYLNTTHTDEYEGFEYVRTERVTSTVTLEKEHILPLFMMTPYYYRTPKEGHERLAKSESLTTEIGMDFIVYKRI